MTIDYNIDQFKYRIAVLLQKILLVSAGLKEGKATARKKPSSLIDYI